MIEMTKKAQYLIPEAVYGYDHPEVISLTDKFLTQANGQNVFSNIKATIAHNKTEETAQLIAAMWHEFTRFVPTFLSKAVVLTKDPEWQHYFIQIAYDELGGKNKDHVHSKLFLEALDSAFINIDADQSKQQLRHVLNSLDLALTNTKSQYGIIGLLLSFEIIAEENIETLFEGLCYREELRETLSDSKFFKIHRQDETEHIRHSIANYLRFCKTDAQKAEFQEAFDSGIAFWLRFWDQMARVVLVEMETLRQA